MNHPFGRTARSAAQMLLLSMVAASGLGADRAAALAPAGRERTALPFSQRLEAASRKYVGTRYLLGPLGEGSPSLGSPKPLINERCVDCVTYLEQSLAHALAERPADVMPLLQRIRYRRGEINFGARNHFFLADWVRNNGWLLADGTRSVGGSAARTVEKRLDRSIPARESGLPEWSTRLPEGGREVPFTVTYIPSAALPKVSSRFPQAAIVAFVSPRKDLDSSHVGFVFRRNGLTLRHASMTKGRVVDQPLLPYVKRRGSHILGVAVITLRDDAPRAHARR